MHDTLLLVFLGRLACLFQGLNPLKISIYLTLQITGRLIMKKCKTCEKELMEAFFNEQSGDDCVFCADDRITLE
mgnify:CR=1 FL=1